MLERIRLPVLELLTLQVLSNLPLFANFVGINMPNSNIGALRALKLAKKEAKRAEKYEQGLNMNISR